MYHLKKSTCMKSIPACAAGNIDGQTDRQTTVQFITVVRFALSKHSRDSNKCSSQP